MPVLAGGKLRGGKTVRERGDVLRVPGGKEVPVRGLLKIEIFISNFLMLFFCSMTKRV